MLFIPTRDRFVMLARAIRSHRAALVGAAARVPLVVIDDSDDAAPVRNVCEETKSTYVGYEHRVRLVEQLGSTAEEREALRFALLPPVTRTTTAVGASRNVAALLGAGRSFVSMDDDETSRFFAPRAPGVMKRVIDPEPIDLLAPSEVIPTTADPWTPHARLLGRSVADTVLATAPPRMRVAMTFMGVVGDLGVGSIGSLAFLSGGSQRRLAAGLLGHVAGGGRAARIAGTVQPSLFPFGMMGAFGLDASRIVPPVLPSGRNQDGLFVLMLRMIDNDACLVHLPLAVAHRLGDGRRFAETDFVRSIARPRIADLARIVALRAPAARPIGSPVERLAMLARAYTDDLPSLAAMEGMWNEHRASQSAQLVRNAQECPSGYLHDATIGLAGSLRVPVRLDAHADGLPIRETLSRFGRLLCVWPAVWERAHARASGGAASRSAA